MNNIAYTNGTSVGAIAATNSNLTIYEGYGVFGLFCGGFIVLKFGMAPYFTQLIIQLIQLIQIIETKVAFSIVQLLKL